MTTKSRVSRREMITRVAASVAGASLLPPILNADSPAAKADYSLQRRAANVKVPEVVTVIGCGGFGAWPAMLLAMCGVKNLTLIDMAIIDQLDLARAPFFAEHVGKVKADALRDIIGRIRPECKVTPIRQHVTTKDLNLFQGVVFNCTNDNDLARNLPALLKKKGQAHYTGVYNGNTLGVFNALPEGISFKTGSQIPVWTAPCALAGALTVYSALVAPISFLGQPENINMSTASINSVASKLRSGEA